MYIVGNTNAIQDFILDLGGVYIHAVKGGNVSTHGPGGWQFAYNRRDELIRSLTNHGCIVLEKNEGKEPSEWHVVNSSLVSQSVPPVVRNIAVGPSHSWIGRDYNASSSSQRIIAGEQPIEIEREVKPPPAPTPRMFVLRYLCASLLYVVLYQRRHCRRSGSASRNWKRLEAEPRAMGVDVSSFWS
jgi:hypothetical protein